MTKKVWQSHKKDMFKTIYRFLKELQIAFFDNKAAIVAFHFFHFNYGFWCPFFFSVELKLPKAINESNPLSFPKQLLVEFTKKPKKSQKTKAACCFGFFYPPGTVTLTSGGFPLILNASHKFMFRISAALLTTMQRIDKGLKSAANPLSRSCIGVSSAAKEFFLFFLEKFIRLRLNMLRLIKKKSGCSQVSPKKRVLLYLYKRKAGPLTGLWGFLGLNFFFKRGFAPKSPKAPKSPIKTITKQHQGIFMPVFLFFSSAKGNNRKLDLMGPSFFFKRKKKKSPIKSYPCFAPPLFIRSIGGGKVKKLSQKEKETYGFAIKSKDKQVVSITYEEIGLFPRSFSRVFDRFVKQLFSDVENLVLQEYRFYRYLFLTTVKCVFILLFVPFLVNVLAKNYLVRPLTEYFWNTKQTEIFLNAYQQKSAFAELQDFDEKLYFESLVLPNTLLSGSINEKSINLLSSPPTPPDSPPLGGGKGVKGCSFSPSPPPFSRRCIGLLLSLSPAELGNQGGNKGRGIRKGAIQRIDKPHKPIPPYPHLTPPLSIRCIGVSFAKGKGKVLAKLKESGLKNKSIKRFMSVHFLYFVRQSPINLTPDPDPKPTNYAAKPLRNHNHPITPHTIGIYSISHNNEKQTLQDKTVELAISYNNKSIEAITNFFADLISFITLCFLLVGMEIQINITKSFLLEVFFGLDDSKKSLLILLVTDLLVGYHSDGPWAILFEYLFNHYGLPESQTGIFLLVATLPVLLDVLFKYLIFRHLNRASPATVATYHAMIE